MDALTTALQGLEVFEVSLFFIKKSFLQAGIN